MFQENPDRTLETGGTRPIINLNLNPDSFIGLDVKDRSSGEWVAYWIKAPGFSHAPIVASEITGSSFMVVAANMPLESEELHIAPNVDLYEGATVSFETVIGVPPDVTPTKVEGNIKIDGQAAARVVRCFTYDSETMNLLNRDVYAPRPLGEATSDSQTGDYSISIESGYTGDVFVVAFDDYGVEYLPSLTMEVGDRVHPTTPNGYVFECLAAGTLPDTEPEWNTDTETSYTYGTASLIARNFYRPGVHGPIKPTV